MSIIRTVGVAAACAGLVSVWPASAGEVRSPGHVSVVPAGPSGVGMASGVPQQARNANNVEFIGCSVLRGAVIVPEGMPAPSFPGPNQVIKCSARSAAYVAAACSSTDPEAVNLMASALASVTPESRLTFYFDGAGVCTHLEVGIHSQLLRAQ